MLYKELKDGYEIDFVCKEILIESKSYFSITDIPTFCHLLIPDNLKCF